MTCQGQPYLGDREVEGDVVLGTGVIGDISELGPFLTGNASHVYMPRHKDGVGSVHIEAQEISCRQEGVGFIVCESGCCKVGDSPACSALWLGLLEDTSSFGSL